MIRIERTHAENPNFIHLVKQLDADLAVRDGEDHTFYHQFNSIDQLKNTIVLYYNEEAVGCGAFKEIEPKIVEIKRMYTIPEFRGKGLATQILTELETWASELGIQKCVLETGKQQPEAIRLYEKNGYSIIPNYGQYRDVANSVCFEKNLLR